MQIRVFEWGNRSMINIITKKTPDILNQKTFDLKRRSLLGWVICLPDMCCLLSTLAFPLYLQRTVTHCLIVLCTSLGDSVLVRELTIFQHKGFCFAGGDRTNTASKEIFICTFYCIVTALCQLVYNLVIYSSVERQQEKLNFRYLNQY